MDFPTKDNEHRYAYKCLFANGEEKIFEGTSLQYVDHSPILNVFDGEDLIVCISLQNLKLVHAKAIKWHETDKDNVSWIKSRSA